MADDSDAVNMMRTHQECWDLLPWLVNGRLSHAEAMRVNNHVDICPRCREEKRFQNSVRDAIRREGAVLLAPQSSLQKLMQRCDGPASDHSSVDAAGPNRPPARAALQSATMRTPRWTIAAIAIQSLVIIALAAQWLFDPNKHIVTQSATVPATPAIRVKFAEEIPLQEVNRLLRSIDARVVGGPSELESVYTLELPSSTSSEAVDSVAQRLQNDPRVLFSQRIPN